MNRRHFSLLLILLLATLLRLWQVNESLWLDELHSAWVVSSGLGEIVERAQMGNQSPLYFYLSWMTTSLFGMSEWTLRLPSLLTGLGVVTVAYGITLQWTRSILAANACALLTALDHNFLFYATEARPYACVQLVAAIQFFVYWKLVHGASRRWRVGFVLASVLLFYLHYTAILLLSGEIVFLLILSQLAGSKDPVTYTVRMLMKDLGLIAVMTAPTALHLVDIGSRRKAWSSFVNDTSLLLPYYWFSLGSYVLLPLAVCVGIGLLFRKKFDPARLRDIGKQIGLLACWLIVPLSMVWLLTATDTLKLYLGRYVIGAALAPILFVGLCIAFWERRSLQGAIACITVIYAVGSSGVIQQVQYDGRLFGDRVENWRGAVEFVNTNIQPDAPVFLRSGLLEADQLVHDQSDLLRAYCISPVTSIYKIDSSNIRPLTTAKPDRLTIEDMRCLEQAGEAWFVINGAETTVKRCRQRVLASLAVEDQSIVVLDEQQFGKVGVFHVVLNSTEQTMRAD